jgi:hypothetical protein
MYRTMADAAFSTKDWLTLRELAERIDKVAAKREHEEVRDRDLQIHFVE